MTTLPSGGSLPLEGFSPSKRARMSHFFSKRPVLASYNRPYKFKKHSLAFSITSHQKLDFKALYALIQCPLHEWQHLSTTVPSAELNNVFQLRSPGAASVMHGKCSTDSLYLSESAINVEGLLELKSSPRLPCRFWCGGNAFGPALLWCTPLPGNVDVLILVWEGRQIVNEEVKIKLLPAFSKEGHSAD